MPSFQSWANGIDDYVLAEMENNSLEDSMDTYSHIVKEITKSMNIHPDTKGTVRMEKIYRWIQEVLRPQREIERKRKDIIGT